jgi:hypothetical protein
MLDSLFKITLISTASFNLNNFDYYLLDSSDGLGMAPSHRITERNSQQHGETDLGFRLDPRLFSLRLSVRCESPTEYYYYRSQLLTIFRPSNDPIILAFTLPNGTNPDLVRRIKCYIEKGLTFDTSKRKSLVQQADVVLRAPDPTFYNPTQTTNSLTLTSDEPQQNLALSYTGTWLCYPVIEIVGPITNPVILNTGTDEKLALTYAVGGSETVTIDTAFGVKTVTNGAGDNLIGKLTDDSDLATFHLDHEIEAGGNIMTCYGTIAGGQHAHINFKYYERFIGI